MQSTSPSHRIGCPIDNLSPPATREPMSIPEVIQHNPILALIIVMVPIVGAMWKVFHELYVKPRDLRIDFLKDDMTRLKGELDEVRRVQAKPAAEFREARDAVSVPSIQATASTDNKPNSVDADPKATSGYDNASLITGHPSSPSVIASPGKQPKTLTPLTSLRQCYEDWKTPSFTKLQTQRFEKDYVGKSVDWNVWVNSVMPSSHGRINLTVRDEGAGFDLPHASVTFSDSYENLLLGVEKDTLVNIKGTIREFFLWPVLDGAEIRSLGLTVPRPLPNER